MQSTNRKRVEMLEATIAELTEMIDRRLAELVSNFKDSSIGRHTITDPRVPFHPLSKPAPLPSSPSFTQAVEEAVELNIVFKGLQGLNSRRNAYFTSFICFMAYTY